MLKHLRNVSDEQVVAQFTENAYYQYFCGMESFSIAAPFAASELVHFRHRIGEVGIELIQCNSTDFANAVVLTLCLPLP